MDRKIENHFLFIIRPMTTINTTSRKLSWDFENEIFKLIKNRDLSINISGILIIPTIMDRNIAEIPSDYAGFNRKDNSVTIGINIDFEEWQNNSNVGRVDILAKNIHNSLNKIDNNYLTETNKETLHQIVDKAGDELIFKFQK